MISSNDKVDKAYKSKGNQMKLAISANNKQRNSRFDYSLEIPDYVIISVLATIAAIAISKRIMKNKGR